MAAEEIKQRQREIYDSIAEIFSEVWARYTGRFAGDLIDILFPQAGESALDLAGGTGSAGLLLAERVGKDGSVHIVDLSPAMLHEAAKEAAARGISNVQTQVMDAEHLDFPDASFDLVVCTFSVMFFPDVPQAMREVARVLKPGGRIGLTVWGSPDRTPLITVPVSSVLRRVSPPPVRILLNLPGLGPWLLRRMLTNGRPGGPPAPLRFGTGSRLETHLTRAGLEIARREQKAYPIEFESFEHFWHAMTCGSPAVDMVRRLPPSVLEQVREETRAGLLQPERNDVYLHNEAILLTGRKPS